MGTTTTNLELYKPDVGEDDWGLLVNANWDVIDALELTGGGLTDVTVLGTPNVAVTSHVTSDAQILGSGARTTTQTVDFTNEYWKGMLLVVNMTAFGSGSVTPAIGAINPITSSVIPLWTAAAAITSNAQFAYLFYPGCITSTTASSGLTETFNCALPRTIRVTITANNANSATYSVASLRAT